MLVDSFLYSSLLCLVSLVVKRICWAGRPTPLYAFVYVLSFHFLAFFMVIGSQSGRWGYAAVMMLGTILATIAYRRLSGDVAYYKAKYPKPVQTASRVRGPEDDPGWTNYHPS